MTNLHTLEISKDGQTVGRICFRGTLEDEPNWLLNEGYTVEYFDPYFEAPGEWYKWVTFKNLIGGVHLGGWSSQYVRCTAQEAARISVNGGKVLLSV